MTGGSNKRVSLAALIAVKPGHQARLIYRVHAGRPRGDRRKGFTETDYARLLDAAHQQLGGPLVVVWDNLNTHVSRAMRELVAARPWLTVFQLPPYASELNPVEGADRADQDSTQAHAVPGRPHRWLPDRDQARPHTPL